MADETKLFGTKLTILKEIINILTFHEFSKTNLEQVLSLTNQLTLLQHNVETEGTLNAGGKFEWVDSILIKCLQDGCWLLIENVNLCSPAVLDRLNALLEPNGVLTIGERGVDENGEMVHIVPHPNFRLFLTMDPKNGEISRAMRNRGVEIYMLNDIESGNKNVTDIKSLIEQNGLNFEEYQNILLELHDYVSEFVLGEKPNISHILQSAFLISQQLLRGINLIQSFKSSIIDVYVKSKSLNDFNTENAIEIIEEHIVTTFKNYFQTESNNSNNNSINNRTLKTMELQSNSNFALVRQQNVLLENTTNLHLLINYLLFNYESSSYNNLKLRHLYLRNVFDQIEDNKLYQLFNQKLGKILQEFFKKKSYAFPNKDMPLDSLWLIDTKEKYIDTKESNQIFVLLQFTMKKIVKEFMELEEPVTKKYSKMTVMQYSKAVYQKKLSQFSIEHPLVNKFYNLVAVFDDFLITLLTNESCGFNSEDTINAIAVLNWRFVLHDMGDLIVFDKSNKMFNLNETLSQLIVRYKWFIKNTVNYFKKYSTISKAINDLSKIMEFINKSVESNFSNFAKISKKFVKNITKPLPLTNVEKINMLHDLQTTINKLSVISTPNNLDKYKLMSITQDVGEQLIEIIKELRKNDFDNATEISEKLDRVKENLNFVLQKEIGLTELQLLPVIDLIGVYITSDLKNIMFLERAPMGALDKCQILRKLSTVPIELKEILDTYFATKDERLIPELRLLTSMYYKNAICLSPSNCLDANTTEEDGKQLSRHVPVLTNVVTSLCIAFDGNRDLVYMANLGKQKDKVRQLRYLNEVMWKTIPGIYSDADFMSNCDAKYITDSFNNFIKLLERSLTGNITSTGSISDSINTCVCKITEIYNSNKESDEMVRNKERVMLLFIKLCTEVEKLQKATNIQKIIHTANVYCLLNYMKANFNSQLQVIDPLEKNVLKKKYSEEERNICTNLCDAFVAQNDIYSGDSKTLHPFVKILSAKINKYLQKETDLEKLVAVRPLDLSYQSLLKDVSHNLHTLLSEDFFMKMYMKLNACVIALKKCVREKTASINIEDSKDAVKQSLNWINSQTNSFKKLSKYRIGYPDIIQDLLSNLTELSYGIQLLSSVLQKLILKFEYINEDLSVMVKNMVQFPVLNETQKDTFKLIKLCTDIKNVNLISNVISDEKVPNLAKHETLRLLKCSIQELYNLFVSNSSRYLEPNNRMLNYLEKLINLFVSAWFKQESDRQKKFEEEQSIYKTQSKCENLTEEEEDYKNMKLLFPNYHELDFADFQKTPLGDSEVSASNNEAETEFVGVITLDDVKFVADIHSEIMLCFTKCEWLNPKNKHLEVNYLTPLLERYKLFALLQNKLIEGLDSEIEPELVSSLNLLVSYTRSCAEGEDLLGKINASPKKGKEKSYDFYKDSKVDEVKSCLHIIEGLKQRSDELLIEWPSHPTLQSINTLIERIYSFPVTSPVSRFLTGLEILLSKCHEWEENAHSGVSLSEYLQTLSLQIISWRKLELTGWKDCLNNAAERINNSVTKWWFHIYSTIEEFTTRNKNDSESNSTIKLIKTFQEFIEKSPLGEYKNRVDLLYTFHCHVLHSSKSPKTDVIIAVLWNLYNYYAQFFSNIETKIKNLRSPIEKKLKDFVKIARWNDISYWAVKETVEKTHKTLHKYIKEFETILKQPVTDCLVNSNNSENVGIWDRPTRSSPSQYHYSLVASNYMASVKFKKLLADTSIISEGLETDSLFSKIEKYFNKSRTLCKDAISATTYPNLIQNLDLFVADIIETSTHLRNLEVNKELTKPKQKSQAKNILQQKRMALADLFKTLAKCGLSYRTGIIEAKLRQDQCSEFLLKPIDLNASFKHNMNRGACDLQLLNMWDGCEIYFLRTIARLAALDAALKQPAQDLGAQNIERCKGFSSHLLVLAQEQKAKLIETTRYFYYIRSYITQLTDCSEVSDVIQTDTLKSINNLLTNTVIIMEQYKIVLISCPDEPAFGSDLLDIPVVNTENQIMIKQRNDPNWHKAFSEIKNIISLAQKVKKLIEKVENKFPSSEIIIDEVEYLYIHDKNSIITELENITMKTKELQDLFGNNSVVNSMSWLRNEMEININLLRHEYCDDKDSEVTVDKYKYDVEKLMEHILLIIQNVYKKYSAKKSSESQGTTPVEEIESSEQFADNHLKGLLVNNLFDDISALEMKSVFKKVKKMNDQLYKMNTEDSKNSKTLISTCIPLLEQVALMYQYFVTQQIGAYRVTCKLSSVLLNIFIELASKGFCIPEEFSDELESEGQNTQQSSGLGLGEGEGERDVSDRIETEDQLDDAQPAGQERKDEDKDCKEQEKGIEMSEDFEGKLQDVEKNPDDQSQSDTDSDAEKQMGDTEQDSNKLDQQIWGSEEENDDDDANNEEESEKQDKEEKGDGGELEDQQMAAKEDGSKPQEDENDPQDNQDKRKEQQKDINEMDEPEYSEDQVDPYHGNQEPLPEPEPMDLPDDLKLDDGEEKEETGEENPFDIDAMKEQTPLEEEGTDDKEKEDNKAEDKDKNNGSSDSSDEEEEVAPTQDNAMETDQPDDQTVDKSKQNEDEKDSAGIQQEKDEAGEEKTPEEENDDASALDNQQSKEDEIQPMDIENIETADNVQTNPNQSQAQKSEQIAQEESEDKDGVGQSQKEESESGHRGEVSAAQDSLNAQQEKEAQQEKRQRPGEADSKRSLGETTEPVKKKLKTVDIQNEEAGDDEAEDEGAAEGKDADIYQHIKEAKETDTQVMDTATKEQAETQRLQKEDEEKKSEEPTKDSAVEMDVDESEPDVVDTPKQNPETTESKSQKKSDGKQKQGDIVEEITDVEIEGDLVATMNVPRGNESSYHTQYDLLSENQIDRLSSLQIQDLRNELETQLGTWNEPPPNIEAEQTWEKFSAITSSLARDLSEQLRLVLEPTQASRLRGDFRTGRRINMRKVIPYIASQFRKDKIWLRRTKPSKREYQIVLAIDDSSSMDDNHSKELAFESVALISKALSLLESGQLSVLSFGETTEILHKLTDTFTEKSGVKLLQKFQFQQKKTCVANLVDFVSAMFSDTHTSAPNAKLLIVVSDGRGIFSEGETFVQQAIRRAKFQDIFMVFVIIDNPENKNSILDIRMPVFKDGKLLGIKSYLDNFPFPFYIILRDINTLPSVLSDALRQWFELVSNVDK